MHVQLGLRPHIVGGRGGAEAGVEHEEGEAGGDGRQDPQRHVGRLLQHLCESKCYTYLQQALHESKRYTYLQQHLELLVGEEDLEAEEVVLAAQVLLQRVPVSTHVCTYTIAPPRIYACIHAGAAAARTGTPLISCICIH